MYMLYIYVYMYIYIYIYIYACVCCASVYVCVDRRLEGLGSMTPSMHLTFEVSGGFRV